jgi:Tol biopolymer transport system component/predicted Ser/Thr protein kinase
MLMIGKTVSHYRIIEKLGEGGMGVVYKALDLKLERFVALKFLPHEISVGAEDRARFLQEARAASAISHPNVCVIHEIAEHEGQQFIVMEYVDGKTLRQLVPIQKVQDALGYAVKIGEALEEAHGKGIVHRDIKTDNIMVAVNNQIKVMDFGLAKLRGSLKLTKTSSTVGTLSYMAPEQIQGGEVDARSDIFSFGVVFYEMLAGQLPFVGEHEAAMMYSILNENPQPIQKFRPELSSELLHVINRALEKDPEDRYQTMHDMVIDLRRAKKETSRFSRAVVARLAGEKSGPLVLEEQRPVGREVSAEQEVRIARKRKPMRRDYLWLSLAGALVVLAAVAVFVVRSMLAPRLNPEMSFRTLAVPFTEMGYASLSRDGSWLAFSARDATSEWSIYFTNVAGGSPRRLVTEHFQRLGDGYAEISPDGSQVLFGGNKPGKPDGIFIVSSLGGTSRNITELGAGARWRPDGQLIGYIQGTSRAPSQSDKLEFWTVRPDGSENHLEFVDSLSRGYSTLCFDWSPDGKSVAWLKSFPGCNEIFIRNLKSGRERQLTANKSPIDEIAWATNNQIFATSSRGGSTNVWMIPARGEEAVQITKGSAPAYGVRVSADGKRLLYVERRTIHHLWTADIDGRNARQLTFDNQELGAPSFSPDKKRISFIMFSPDPLHRTSNVFVMNGDGTNRTQLTSAEACYREATWSLDGKYIAYTSYRFGEPLESSRVDVMDVSTAGTPRAVGKGTTMLWMGAEELVIFDLGPRPQSALYSIRKSEPIEVSRDSTSQIPLADGKHILVWDNRRGKAGIWVKTTGMAQSVAPRQIVSAEYCESSFPTVSLRYLLSAQGNGEIWLISLPDGKRARLPEIFNDMNPYNLEIQLSYDDKQVVYLKGQLDSRLVLIEDLFK